MVCTVDNISGSENIVKRWKHHYYALFKFTLSEQINIKAIDKNKCLFIRAHGVYQAEELPDNKTCGVDGMYAEHLKHACISLLAICFTYCLNNGILPDSLLSVTLVQVMKDKVGRLESLDNYRPIAPASTASKLLEKVLLSFVLLSI